MIVIEGKAGKIREVDKITRDFERSTTLFVNMSGESYPDMLLSCPMSYVLKRDRSVWGAVNCIMSNIEDFKKFETIVFYANCSINDIKSIRIIEGELGSECIVTVQNDEMEQLRVYEL